MGRRYYVKVLLPRAPIRAAGGETRRERGRAAAEEFRVSQRWQRGAAHMDGA